MTDIPEHAAYRRPHPALADPQGHAERSARALTVVYEMEKALGRASNEMERHFHEDFAWRGNQGCGVKRGLDAFRRNWQFPIRAAFTDRVYKTEQFIADGDWAACFGVLEATHSGTFMGITATGKRIAMPYMDFWRIEDGRIKDNPVFVDFAFVLAQLGRDVFDGHGWEQYDSGAVPAPNLAGDP